MDRPTPTRADYTNVGDVMTKDVLCVQPDISVETLTELFLEHGISGAPVVDDKGKPIGMITKTDLVRQAFEAGDTTERDPQQEREEQLIRERLGFSFHPQPIARVLVGEIMTPVAFTVETTTSLSQAAALMAYQQVHHTPVVTGSGVVIGMLSSMDILRWLGEEDGYLRRE